nr:unnamed protein product [Callosobruchus chinensis]
MPSCTASSGLQLLTCRRAGGIGRCSHFPERTS